VGGRVPPVLPRGYATAASWKDIDKFEKNNPKLSVNVYGYENGIGVYP